MSETSIATIGDESLRSRIHTIRGVQVILAQNLADLYQVSTGVFNQSVKRNEERFPDGFRFQLTKEELEEVITVCDNPNRLRFSPALPFAFTEQGVAMLSGILKSDVAVQTSIRLMNTFVAMRRTLATLSPLLTRIEAAERRQIVDQSKNEANQQRNEERFEKIFDAMRDKKFPPQKVFFDGEFFDAFVRMKKFIRQAKNDLVVIDPYFDDSCLPLIAQKRPGVAVTVVRSALPRLANKLSAADVAQFNKQYANSLIVKLTDKFHDRYLIIDNATLIHVGASLNHLGKRCFAFSTMDASFIPDIMARVP